MNILCVDFLVEVTRHTIWPMIPRILGAVPSNSVGFLLPKIATQNMILQTMRLGIRHTYTHTPKSTKLSIYYMHIYIYQLAKS